MSESRQWMYRRYLPEGGWNPRFLEGLEEFIQVASSKPAYLDKDKIRCPCKKCDNKRYTNPMEVRYHLARFGFVKDYHLWRFQGEKIIESSAANTQTGEKVIESSAANTQKGEKVIESSAANTQKGKKVIESSAANTQEGEKVIESSAANTQKGKKVIESSAANTQKSELIIESSAANTQKGEKIIESGAKTPMDVEVGAPSTYDIGVSSKCKHLRKSVSVPERSRRMVRVQEIVATKGENPNLNKICIDEGFGVKRYKKRRMLGIESLSQSSAGSSSSHTTVESPDLVTSLREKLREELREDLREEVREELREEFRDELQQEVWQEFKQELKQELCQEMDKELKSESMQKWKNEIAAMQEKVEQFIMSQQSHQSSHTPHDSKKI